MKRWLLLFAIASIGSAHAQSFRDCPTICPEMVTAPPGSASLGPASGEEEREGIPEARRQGDQRKITISRPFALGKYEVTRGEFAAFVAATGYQAGISCWGWDTDGVLRDAPGRSWRSAGFEQTDNHPVMCVNWDDAKAYAAWLSKLTGKTYRLPSEAEWEYAARGGTTTARYWGNALEGACQYGNFADLTGAAALNWEHKPDKIFLCADNYVYTSPVGTYKPNAFGLYDMLGNVWEWVEDCYNVHPQDAPTDGSPLLTGDCAQRLLRGGSWYSSPYLVRAAYRYFGPSGVRSRSVGFRIARTE
ncbi:MAG TPA: formylglycine-generating enzyme family protein [Reyranella sp.]|nr:formylglycine-generating enzyme family protein [Reyranella sp.]